jgi:Na+-driven multidrug efflux pump
MEQGQLFDGLASIPKTEAECNTVFKAQLDTYIYKSLTDAVNVSFAFALRGAGDTKFVTLLTFSLAWPLMVIPTFVAVQLGASIYWCWAFATLHILGMSVCFWFRFRSGKWKSMRVIEPAMVDEKEGASW